MPDNPNDFFVLFETGIPVPTKNIRAYKKNNVCPVGWVRKTEQQMQDLMNSEEVQLWLLWLPIRQKRNELLAECDWVVLPDSPFTELEVTQWKVYRQSLRDITTDFALPNEVIWPAKP